VDAGKRCNIAFSATKEAVEDLVSAIDLYLLASERFDRFFNGDKILRLNLIKTILIDEIQYVILKNESESNNGKAKTKKVEVV